MIDRGDRFLDAHRRQNDAACAARGAKARGATYAAAIYAQDSTEAAQEAHAAMRAMIGAFFKAADEARD